MLLNVIDKIKKGKLNCEVSLESRESTRIEIKFKCEILQRFTVLILMFVGFCEQAFLQACSLKVSLSLAMFQTLGW